nr:MAG TPA: hypothetical protein [Caudoviricetes sp.]
MHLNQDNRPQYQHLYSYTTSFLFLAFQLIEG